MDSSHLQGCFLVSVRLLSMNSNKWYWLRLLSTFYYHSTCRCQWRKFFSFRKCFVVVMVMGCKFLLYDSSPPSLLPGCCQRQHDSGSGAVSPLAIVRFSPMGCLSLFFFSRSLALHFLFFLFLVSFLMFILYWDIAVTYTNPISRNRYYSITMNCVIKFERKLKVTRSRNQMNG